jgi:hypothetical protein
LKKDDDDVIEANVYLNEILNAEWEERYYGVMSIIP